MYSRSFSSLAKILFVTSFLYSGLVTAQVLSNPVDNISNQANATPEATEFSALEVNGLKISVLDLKTALENNIRENGGKDSNERRAAVQNDLLIQALLAQRAKAKGLDKAPAHQSQMRLGEYKSLSQAYFDAFSLAFVPDEKALLQEYDRVTKSIGTTEYDWAQIVVGSKAEADQVLLDLKSGQPFASIARAKTIDMPRRSKSGSMGWTNPAQLQPDVASALTGLKPGQYSQFAINIDSAWHMVQLKSTRPYTAPPFDSVKTNLTLRQLELAFEKHLSEIKSQAKIK